MDLKLRNKFRVITGGSSEIGLTVAKKLVGKGVDVAIIARTQCLLEEAAAIINTASICAKQPLDYEPIYNTTKAALAMFSKCLANELAETESGLTRSTPALSLPRTGRIPLLS